MIKLSSSIHREKKQDAGHTHTYSPLLGERDVRVHAHACQQFSVCSGYPLEDMLGEVSFGEQAGWQREAFPFHPTPICEVCTCNMSMYY